MTFAAVGSAFQTDANPWTFTPPASSVGDLVCVPILNDSNTVHATALSSSNVTWTFAVTYTEAHPASTSLFLGKITSTSAASVTITWSAGTTPTFIRGDGQVFSSTVGSWALDTSANIDSAGGITTWPSLTAAATLELYFGYAFTGGAGMSAGSTSGFTYFVDSHSNGMAYNVSVGSGSVTGPTWGGSGANAGLVALIKETSAAAAVPIPYLSQYNGMF